MHPDPFLITGVGESVAVEDVVAVIETDKVSVDIKAEQAGVITAFHCGVEDTVLVGADLYSIDTEGTPTVASKAAPAPPAPLAASAPPAPAPTPSVSPSTPAPSSTTHESRIPSIKFRYGARAAGTC